MEALVDALQAASPKLRFEDVAPRLCGGNRNIQLRFQCLLASSSSVSSAVGQQSLVYSHSLQLWPRDCSCFT